MEAQDRRLPDPVRGCGRRWRRERVPGQAPPRGLSL